MSNTPSEGTQPYHNTLDREEDQSKKIHSSSRKHIKDISPTEVNVVDAIKTFDSFNKSSISEAKQTLNKLPTLNDQSASSDP